MSNPTINKQLAAFENDGAGILGLSAIHIETQRTLSFNEDQSFLMCSTYKFPIAIYLLHCVEHNNFDLDALYALREVDKRPGYAFTLNDFDCRNGFPISYRNLLIMMMRESCNTSTDVILRKLGGPEAVTQYLHQINIHDMTIDRYTLEVIAQSDGITQLPANLECTLEEYKKLAKAVTPAEFEVTRAKFLTAKLDCSTPNAMTDLLVKLFNSEPLTKENSAWLLSIMRRNKLYPNRLMGLLPRGTPVAHKTGTANGYVNDVGIITLPYERGHIAISVFISQSKKDRVQSEKVIAEVSRTVYDYFLFG